MKKILIIITAIVLLVIFLLFVTMLESLKNSGEDSTSQTRTSPQAFYDKEATDYLIMVVSTRPALSESDQKAKREIIKLLDNENDSVEDNMILLEYVASADSFWVELKTERVDFDKQKTINYLKEQGLSEEGICKLPLVFYLNYEVASAYKKTGEAFSPIPTFCYNN